MIEIVEEALIPIVGRSGGQNHPAIRAHNGLPVNLSGLQG
jgi:hypothetical protein